MRFPGSKRDLREHRHLASKDVNAGNTMNITPVFNQVLASHNAQPVGPYVFRVENLDEFLKEAYRIVGHVTRLGLEGG